MLKLACPHCRRTEAIFEKQKSEEIPFFFKIHKYSHRYTPKIVTSLCGRAVTKTYLSTLIQRLWTSKRCKDSMIVKPVKTFGIVKR